MTVSSSRGFFWSDFGSSEKTQPEVDSFFGVGSAAAGAGDVAGAANPAGQSILSRFFKDGVSPLGLLLGALIPTIVVYLCFIILPNGTTEVEPGAAPAIQQTTHP